MFFPSWTALCGWNRVSSLLRATYSVHAILFEPHAKSPLFLLGSSHQTICDSALCACLKCRAMPSPVGRAQHTLCNSAIQSQHDPYSCRKLPQGWRTSDLHSRLLMFTVLNTSSMVRMVNCSLSLYDYLYPTDKSWQCVVHCPQWAILTVNHSLWRALTGELGTGVHPHTTDSQLWEKSCHSLLKQRKTSFTEPRCETGTWGQSWSWLISLGLLQDSEEQRSTHFHHCTFWRCICLEFCINQGSNSTPPSSGKTRGQRSKILPLWLITES